MWLCPSSRHSASSLIAREQKSEGVFQGQTLGISALQKPGAKTGEKVQQHENKETPQQILS